MEDWAREWLEGERAKGVKCLEIKVQRSNHYVYHSTTHWDKVLKKPVKTSKYLGVNSGVKVHNPGGIEVHSSRPFASSHKRCGDVGHRRVPHVKGSVQSGMEHNRDRPTNGV